MAVVIDEAQYITQWWVNSYLVLCCSHHVKHSFILSVSPHKKNRLPCWKKKPRLRSLYNILQVHLVCSKQLCPKQFSQWYEERSKMYLLFQHHFGDSFLNHGEFFNSIRLVDYVHKVPRKKKMSKKKSSSPFVTSIHI